MSLVAFGSASHSWQCRKALGMLGKKAAGVWWCERQKSGRGVRALMPFPMGFDGTISPHPTALLAAPTSLPRSKGTFPCPAGRPQPPASPTAAPHHLPTAGPPRGWAGGVSSRPPPANATPIPPHPSRCFPQRSQINPSVQQTESSHLLREGRGDPPSTLRTSFSFKRGNVRQKSGGFLPVRI